jgi:hypothetical protein
VQKATWFLPPPCGRRPGEVLGSCASEVRLRKRTHNVMPCALLCAGMDAIPLGQTIQKRSTTGSSSSTLPTSAACVKQKTNSARRNPEQNSETNEVFPKTFTARYSRDAMAHRSPTSRPLSSLSPRSPRVQFSPRFALLVQSLHVSKAGSKTTSVPSVCVPVQAPPIGVLFGG